MTNLLKIEWLKIKNYRAFLIISLFFALGVFTSNYIVYSVFSNMVNEAQTATLIGRFNPYDFYYTWQTTSYTTGFLLMLPALYSVLRSSIRSTICSSWSGGSSISDTILVRTEPAMSGALR